MGNPPVKSRYYLFLFLLFAVNTLNFFDRNIPGVVGEQVKKEWQLSDFQWGIVGTAFTLLYAVVGIPLGEWADRGVRTRILSIGVTLWSLLTTASGLAWSYTSMFVIRLGVGVGEATCAPVATSLIGDMAPPAKRAGAMSIFMLGLPVGMCTSFWLGGEVAKLLSWRWAMILAGIPGLVIGIIAWFLPEPERAAPPADEPSMYQVMRSLFLNPIMILLMISGAIHNFNMYAFAFFSSSYFQRFHGLDVKVAGRILGIAYGVGGLGILLGGWLCDRVASRRPGGRLEVSTLAIFLSVICYFFGLYCAAGLVYQSALWFLFSYLLSCIYYPGVYATIQDVTTPRQRGKAMAIYFCVMYLIGGSFGTSVTGWLSDKFAREAALAQGVVVLKAADMPPEAAAIGLRTAFFELPILSLVLAFVLLAASRLVAAQLRVKASAVVPRTEPA